MDWLEFARQWILIAFDLAWAEVQTWPWYVWALLAAAALVCLQQHRNVKLAAKVKDRDDHIRFMAAHNRQLLDDRELLENREGQHTVCSEALRHMQETTRLALASIERVAANALGDDEDDDD